MGRALFIHGAHTWGIHIFYGNKLFTLQRESDVAGIMWHGYVGETPRYFSPVVQSREDSWKGNNNCVAPYAGRGIEKRCGNGSRLRCSWGEGSSLPTSLDPNSRRPTTKRASAYINDQRPTAERGKGFLFLGPGTRLFRRFSWSLCIIRKQSWRGATTRKYHRSENVRGANKSISSFICCKNISQRSSHDQKWSSWSNWGLWSLDTYDKKRHPWLFLFLASPEAWKEAFWGFSYIR